MNFIDDEHADIHLPAHNSHLIAKRSRGRAVWKAGADADKDFFIQMSFIGVGRHLDRCNGQMGEAGCLVENSSVRAQELLQYTRLPHASRSMKEQAWHSVPWRMNEQVGYPLHGAQTSGVFDPSFVLDPSNSFLGRQQCDCTAVLVQMIQVLDQFRSSTLNGVTVACSKSSSSGTLLSGVRVFFVGA
jgi:hypothetical protein